MERAIPLVDLKKFTTGTPEEKKKFVDELGHAFQEFGFVGVVNHGISKGTGGPLLCGGKSFLFPADGSEEPV